MYPITIAISRVLLSEGISFSYKEHQEGDYLHIKSKYIEPNSTDTVDSAVVISVTRITGENAYWVIISHSIVEPVEYHRLLKVISGLHYECTRVTNKTLKEVYYFEPVEDYTLINENRHGTLVIKDRPSIRELMLISPSIPDGHEYIHTNKGITTGLIKKVD